MVKTPQSKCLLCGGDHHTHFCRLPGAAHFRRLLKASQEPKVKQMILKKPRRFSTIRSRGNYRAKTQLEYSGKQSGILSKAKNAARKNPTWMRRPAVGDVALHAANHKLHVQEMDGAGYLNIPSKCPTCKVGYLKEKSQAAKGSQVKFACNYNYCGAKFSALSFSNVLPSKIGRGLNPTKVHEGIKFYTSAGISSPPSPEAAAKQLQCGKKPMTRLFAALRAKEALLGERLNAKTRLKVNVEVDGHQIRCGRISHKVAERLYPHLIADWQKKHKHDALPKYWLMPIILLGAWERGADKGLFAPGRLKLSAPASKPGTEGLEEVRAADFFQKVAKKSVVFPDGAVSWYTNATESKRGLRVAAVVHQKQQFVYKDRRAKVRGASRWRGTQTIDRRWDSLNKWIGNNIATLKKGRPNPQLMQRVRSYQWRVAQRDVYTALGAACKS